MFKSYFRVSKEAEEIANISSNLTTYEYNSEAVNMKLLQEVMKHITEVNKMSIAKLRGVAPDGDKLRRIKVWNENGIGAVQRHVEAKDITQADADIIEKQRKVLFDRIAKLEEEM